MSQRTYLETYKQLLYDLLFIFFFPYAESAAAETAEDAAPGSTTEPATASAAAAGGGTPEDLIAWFNSTTQEYDALFLVYYRGLW